MAEFQISNSRNKYRKVSSPRVDLTPMVDLGFLLITFFMYTTTLTEAKAMDISMPGKPIENVAAPAIPAEATLVIIPSGRQSLAYYQAMKSAETLSWTSITANGLRQLLESEKARITALPTTFSTEAHRLHVLIKPDTSASLDNLVRTLDEMQIVAVPYYTVMPLNTTEKAALLKFPAINL